MSRKEAIRAFVVDAVHVAEGAPDETRYAASFAQKGKSGLSFGRCQHDVAVNDDARKKFETALKNAKDDANNDMFTNDEYDKVLELSSRSGVTAEDFEKEAPGLLEKVNAALNTEEARTAIDGLDAAREKVVIGFADTIMEAAKRNPNGPGVFDPDHPDFAQAIAMAAQWGNRSGGVATLAAWAEGKEVKLSTTTDKPETCISDGPPSLGGMDDYFSKTKYFRDDAPDELPKWTERHAGFAKDAMARREKDYAFTDETGESRPAFGGQAMARSETAEAGQEPAGSPSADSGSDLEREPSASLRQPAAPLPQAQARAAAAGTEPTDGLPHARPLHLPTPVTDQPGASQTLLERAAPATVPAHGPAAVRPLPDASATMPGHAELPAAAMPRVKNLLFDPIDPADLQDDMKPVSTLEYLTEVFAEAASGRPEGRPPKRPAWFRPSNPQELTTDEYIWQVFNPGHSLRRRV
ncbi:hypothetical protein dsat_2095 [Alkalidesulfovibrio alkalitolerans DSM 16529]|uniref:Uncharacterized protein n=1 Tax=Alkalidesulfovibrio alkalitolerans DSM 16529 TaxID=1121439 RepID=S7UN31_9BACT|nr:hypothetical protein [Alkalidesulfovibrio alkalitolerans]EPR35394.1 hypothetical protein dsat_2095 [Alkalidesulfovibrio alkalitolerans DSM 16529]